MRRCASPAVSASGWDSSSCRAAASTAGRRDRSTSWNAPRWPRRSPPAATSAARRTVRLARSRYEAGVFRRRRQRTCGSCRDDWSRPCGAPRRARPRHWRLVRHGPHGRRRDRGSQRPARPLTVGLPLLRSGLRQGAAHARGRRRRVGARSLARVAASSCAATSSASSRGSTSRICRGWSAPGGVLRYDSRARPPPGTPTGPLARDRARPATRRGRLRRQRAADRSRQRTSARTDIRPRSVRTATLACRGSPTRWTRVMTNAAWEHYGETRSGPGTRPIRIPHARNAPAGESAVGRLTGPVSFPSDVRYGRRPAPRPSRAMVPAARGQRRRWGGDGLPLTAATAIFPAELSVVSPITDRLR